MDAFVVPSSNDNDNNIMVVKEGKEEDYNKNSGEWSV
jgi:hypothetical protein